MSDILIYTDGACKGNNHKGKFPGGWASIILEDGKEHVLSGNEKKVTNNKMELVAVYEALEHVSKDKLENVIVYSDSEYVCNSLNKWLRKWSENEWKNSKGRDIAYVDIWKKIFYITKNINIIAKHVPAHSGHPYNERCDRIAKTEAASVEFDNVPTIFIDFETTGFDCNKNFVVSVCAIRQLVDIEHGNVFDDPAYPEPYVRYYYPEDGIYPHRALHVNELDQKAITSLRESCKYPKFYNDDKESLMEYCKGVKHFVAHNANFDRKFSKIVWPNTFCTCAANTNIVKIPMKSAKGGFKRPKLAETAEYYDISKEGIKLHDAYGDTYLCKEIFKNMLQTPISRDKLINFLIG